MWTFIFCLTRLLCVVPALSHRKMSLNRAQSLEDEFLGSGDAIWIANNGEPKSICPKSAVCWATSHSSGQSDSRIRLPLTYLQGFRISRWRFRFVSRCDLWWFFNRLSVTHFACCVFTNVKRKGIMCEFLGCFVRLMRCIFEYFYTL